jgi:hypothetical protein
MPVFRRSTLRPIIYVEYLENAPWNQYQPDTPPRFQGVGSLLVEAAIAQSRADGFKGRIGLHSLPQSVGFYVKHCGMTDLGADRHDERHRKINPSLMPVFMGILPLDRRDHTLAEGGMKVCFHCDNQY